MSQASKPLPDHVRGLWAYLGQPSEKANEDQALTYFRKVFGDAFTRQHDAKGSDGYVPGIFVLEFKGRSNDWLSGLFQGLAYKNHELDFSQVVVVAKHFLAIWKIEDIPAGIREEIASETSAPSTIGRRYARKYAARKKDLLKRSVWNGAELFTPLFRSNIELVQEKICSFELTLRNGRKVRNKITIKNFPSILKHMKGFFEPHPPTNAVRAFYSMLFSWSETSSVGLSKKSKDQATIGGEIIRNLLPAKRVQFKDFVENHYVSDSEDVGYDEYFSRYDKALDSVDNHFRIRHGIFFTDLDLSRFVMWFVRKYIPDLGRNYLVIDPACGSGNLVTNWRSPLELRHKVVSEIEPELLFAVERRMKGDAWHHGRFTVVPKVSENRGLNFLDRSAEDYLNQIRSGLKEKGLEPDKPLAFLCNPPYRSDDDQTASAVSYQVHPTILDLTGPDAAKERYCCFLAQMKLVCEAAKNSGLPGDSLLLLFTKSTWLTQRPIFQEIRREMLGSFELVSGALLKAGEFFDVKGSWPIAFTVWRHKETTANLDFGRSVPLVDLTWLAKGTLSKVPWSDPERVEIACQEILSDDRSQIVPMGVDRLNIREWANASMFDFKRDRRKRERGARVAGGLPANDRRHSNKKVYGEINGRYIGFMDDLTPCRVKNSVVGKPWLNLDNRFMAVRRARCFSGPPTHLGYCAANLDQAKKLFFWYALSRAFAYRPYPTWIDADGMWAPSIPESLELRVFQTAFAVAYAENECVETSFPANNPIKDAPEITITNPMTPLDQGSFWSAVLKPYFDDDGSSSASKLIASVDALFESWACLFRNQVEIIVPYCKPYLVGDGKLTRTAGLIQIKDYAIASDSKPLLARLDVMQKTLRETKEDFLELVTTRLDYFGTGAKRREELFVPEKTRFEKVLCKRLALAGLLVEKLHKERNFGRTKLAKLFYLADTHERLNLETDYYREAAGPLDQRALYNERYGIEALAQKHRIFSCEAKGKMIRYQPSSRFGELPSFAAKHLGAEMDGINKLTDALKDLSTDQSEIVATLYACWNDFLIKKHAPTDEEIVTEFLLHWHTKKSRFSRARLHKALSWMRRHGIVPRGTGKPTSTKMQM